MEILQLKYFCTAARLENISKAARIYDVPQPAMSQTISRLEKELGEPLFDRSGNKIYLNSNGSRFLEYAQSALDNLENGISAVRHSDGTLTGNINMLVLENRTTVIDIVADFSKKHPGVAFTINHDYNDNVSSDFDLCIASVCPVPKLSRSELIINEEILLAVPLSHPLSNKSSVNLRDVIDEQFVSLPPKSSLYQIAQQQFRKIGHQFRVNILCDDPFSIRRYVSKGMGIAFVPEKSWAGLFDENIALLHLSGSGFSRGTRIFWGDGGYISDPVAQFRDFVISSLG